MIEQNGAGKAPGSDGEAVKHVEETAETEETPGEKKPPRKWWQARWFQFGLPVSLVMLLPLSTAGCDLAKKIDAANATARQAIQIADTNWKATILAIPGEETRQLRAAVERPCQNEKTQLDKDNCDAAKKNAQDTLSAWANLEGFKPLGAYQATIEVEYKDTDELKKRFSAQGPHLEILQVVGPDVGFVEEQLFNEKDRNLRMQRKGAGSRFLTEPEQKERVREAGRKLAELIYTYERPDSPFGRAPQKGNLEFRSFLQLGKEPLDSELGKLTVAIGRQCGNLLGRSGPSWVDQTWRSMLFDQFDRGRPERGQPDCPTIARNMVGNRIGDILLTALERESAAVADDTKVVWSLSQTWNFTSGEQFLAAVMTDEDWKALKDAPELAVRVWLHEAGNPQTFVAGQLYVLPIKLADFNGERPVAVKCVKGDSGKVTKTRYVWSVVNPVGQGFVSEAGLARLKAMRDLLKTLNQEQGRQADPTAAKQVCGA